MNSPLSIPEFHKCADNCICRRRCHDCHVLGSQLLQFITDAMDVAKRYYCYECNADFGESDAKSFTGWGALQVHMNKEHFHSRLYLCKVCARGFLDPSAATRCKHKGGLTPVLRLNTSDRPDLEKTERRRKEVMDRLQAKHAIMLGVSPSVLSELREYPVWAPRCQRHPSASKHLRRETKCTGNEEVSQASEPETPTWSTNALPIVTDGRPTDRLPSTFAMHPLSHKVGFVEPTELLGEDDLFNPTFPPHRAHTTHRSNQENAYPRPSLDLTNYSSFDRAPQAGDNPGYLPCLHDLIREWGLESSCQVDVVPVATLREDGGGGL